MVAPAKHNKSAVLVYLESEKSFQKAAYGVQRRAALPSFSFRKEKEG